VRLNARQILDAVRLELEDESGAQGSYFTDAFLLQLVRRVHAKMVNKAIDAAEDFFATIQDVSLVAGQAIYPLFDNFLRLRLVEYLPGGTGEARQLIEGRKVEGLFGASSGVFGDGSEAYAVYGEDLQLDPKPTASEANALKVYYVAEPPPLIIGTATAGAASSITLASDAPSEDDSLNGSFIDITSGLGAGQRRKVSDYVGDTKVATITPNWTTSPNATSLYATVPQVPRLFHDLLVVGAVVRAKASRGEDGAAHADEENDLYEEYDSFVEQRTMASRCVAIFDPYDGLA